jgi:hypothetical protein
MSSSVTSQPSVEELYQHPVEIISPGFFTGRIWDLASHVNHTTLAIFVTIIAFCSANFISALFITGAVWCIALNGNIISSLTALINQLNSSGTNLGGREIERIET